MREYQTIWMDLDGTLVDSQQGIVRGVQLALEHFGLQEENLQALRRFIGPPLLDSFQEYYDLSPLQAQQAVECYRAYYRQEGIFLNTLYSGVEDFLREMSALGKPLYVASSKPEEMVKIILNQHGIAHYFDGIYGASLDQSRTSKVQVLTYGLSRQPHIDREKAVMVGDRKYDVLGAAQVGMDCIGVLYGFGDVQELEEAGAVAVVSSLPELGQLLSGKDFV